MEFGSPGAERVEHFDLRHRNSAQVDRTGCKNSKIKVSWWQKRREMTEKRPGHLISLLVCIRFGHFNGDWSSEMVVKNIKITIKLLILLTAVTWKDSMMFKFQVLMSETVGCVVFITTYIHSLIFTCLLTWQLFLSIMCAGKKNL